MSVAFDSDEMAHQSIDDLTFALKCIKHTPAKPDFDALANDLGVAKQTAYHRHWRLMKTLTQGDGAAAAASPSGSGTLAPATPKTPRKRSSKSTAFAGKDDPDEDDAVEAIDENPPKKRVRKSTAGRITATAPVTPTPAVIIGKETVKGKAKAKMDPIAEEVEDFEGGTANKEDHLKE